MTMISQIPVDQGATRIFTADPWSKAFPASEVYKFVRDQVTRVVQGLLPEPLSPPTVDLVCSFTMPVCSEFRIHDLLMAYPVV
jgi:hypothetical protein